MIRPDDQTTPSGSSWWFRDADQTIREGYGETFPLDDVGESERVTDPQRYLAVLR